MMDRLTNSAWTGRCNLCNWPIVTIARNRFGTRCVRCLSTQIHRAVGHVVAGLGLPRTAGVYELSSRGALHRFLKRRFAHLYCSEYFDGVPSGSTVGRVPCQDVQQLRLDDSLFNLVTCTEVFEHVADDRRGFAEVFRVLRPGGRFVFSVPLLNCHATLERATIGPDGAIVHLLEPEYHSDRLRGSGRVLAFRTYGQDILERLQTAGFAAEIMSIRSGEALIDNQQVVVGSKRSEEP
jgi:SAM-dependent methyltransferase